MSDHALAEHLGINIAELEYLRAYMDEVLGWIEVVLQTSVFMKHDPEYMSEQPERVRRIAGLMKQIYFISKPLRGRAKPSLTHGVHHYERSSAGKAH